ncbi:MAG TPA: MFS transporter, partial [Candidatus Tectomicrobia bacterium]|nr:MFS transporter [Candidatus Tectomicrobia bacterium]
LRDVRDGASFALGHPLLRPVFLTQAVFNGAFFVLQAVYVPYAVDHLGLTASEVGLTLAAYGAGMLAGATMAGPVIRALPFGIVIVAGPLAGVAAALAMVLTVWAPSMWLAAVAFFLIGVGPILWVIATMTLRQTVTPGDLLGRVSAVFTTATGARPLGAALGALVGARYGAEACLVVAAVGFVAQAMIILASPVPRLANQPARADGPRSG